MTEQPLHKQVKLNVYTYTSDSTKAPIPSIRDRPQSFGTHKTAGARRSNESRVICWTTEYAEHLLDAAGQTAISRLSNGFLKTISHLLCVQVAQHAADLRVRNERHAISFVVHQ